VATGRAHVVADPIMNPWDLISVLPVLRRAVAVAVVTSWNGGDPSKASNIIAAAPKLHVEVMGTLRE
jgi:histidinol-phosphatase